MRFCLARRSWRRHCWFLPPRTFWDLIRSASSSRPTSCRPDITGSEILEETKSGQRGFRFILGPIFTQMLLADEINRASPRTQSALLQAMQEYRVTQSGEEHVLPRPFHVLATQNPLDMEGAYPLPEAQLDRFMLCIKLTYPHADAEKRMLVATTGVKNRDCTALLRRDPPRRATSYP